MDGQRHFVTLELRPLIFVLTRLTVAVYMYWSTSYQLLPVLLLKTMIKVAIVHVL